MALFAAISAASSWQIVSYALFATGIAAIVMSDCARGLKMRTAVGICITLSGLGLLTGAHPALFLILPIGFAASLVTELFDHRESHNRVGNERKGKARDDPLTNLCVSLPSVVALLAFLALA